MTYKEKYFEIINTGLKDKPESGYYERHHIVPKSICPLLKNSKQNLIYLTAQNHFLAHYYILKWFKEELNDKKWARKMCYAFNMMKRIITKSDNVDELSKLYEEVRIDLSELQKGQIPWNKGKTGIYTEETLKKMSEAAKGKYCGKNNPMYGIHLTGEKKYMYGKDFQDYMTKEDIERRKENCRNARLGKIIITDGVCRKMWDKNTPIPEGWIKWKRKPKN